MTISRAAVNQYTATLNKASSLALNEFTGVFNRVMGAYTQGNVGLSDVQAILSDSLFTIANKYGEATGLLSKQLFELLSQTEYGQLLEADLINAIRVQDAEQIVEAAFLQENNNMSIYSALKRDIDLLVKRPARDTMENAIDEHANTGVRWARIPQGRETCAFCVMLASRGFVYASEWTAGGSGHDYHAHCDCAVMPSWSDDPKVRGYDPDAYYNLYRTARNAVGGAGKEYRSELLSTMRDLGGNLVSDAHVSHDQYDLKD